MSEHNPEWEKNEDRSDRFGWTDDSGLNYLDENDNLISCEDWIARARAAAKRLYSGEEILTGIELARR
jgi:hypothetical protein